MMMFVYWYLSNSLDDRQRVFIANASRALFIRMSESYPGIIDRLFRTRNRGEPGPETADPDITTVLSLHILAPRLVSMTSIQANTLQSGGPREVDAR